MNGLETALKVIWTFAFIGMIGFLIGLLVGLYKLITWVF